MDLDAKITHLMSAMEQTYQERSNLDIMIRKHEVSGNMEESTPIDCDISCTCNLHVVPRYRTSLARVDTRLDLIMASFEKTSLERWSLVAQIGKLQGAHSPLRRLPTELLSLIFTFANIPGSDPLAYKRSPWNFSQVCAQWRAIALAQLALWSTFVVDSGNKIHTKFRLENQLQRAGWLPLDITFILRKNHSNDPVQRDMLKVVARYSAQWQRFTLSCPTALYTALSCITGALPLLQELRIQIFASEIIEDAAALEVDDEDASPEVDDDDATSQVDTSSEMDDDAGSEAGNPAALLAASADIFNVAPELSAAYIDVVPELSIALPTSQLLRYRGTWDAFVNAFTSGGNLVECALTTSSAEELAETISLPNLLCLSLCGTQALEYLHTPALQTLHWESGAEDVTALLPFFARVPCKLQTLALSQTDITSHEAFGDLFRAVPVLTQLGVTFASPASLIAVLSALHDTDAVPQLKSLTLALRQDACQSFFNFNYELLADMLETRWTTGNNPGRLLSVDIWGSTYHPYEALARIGPLMSQGLEVTVWDPDSIYYNSKKWSVFDIALREGLIPPHKRNVLCW